MADTNLRGNNSGGNPPPADPPRDAPPRDAPPPRAPADPNTGRVPPRDPALNQNLPDRDELMPTIQEMELLTASVAANKVATRQVVTTILAQLRAQRPESNVSAVDLIELAMACMHNGSSKFTVLEGESSHRIPFAQIADVVKSNCTLRQFCMYYAKVCYNLARERNQPPANWAAKGYKEDTKFAAFDFFNGVSNPAAPTPPGGMKYVPSPAEMAASAVNAQMAIMESRQQEDQHSTRGNMLAMRQVRAPPRQPMITFE